MSELSFNQKNTWIEHFPKDIPVPAVILFLAALDTYLFEEIYRS